MNKPKVFRWTAALAAAMSGLLASANASETILISTLDLSKVEQGWGSPGVDKSVDGHQLSIAGEKFEHGFGTHAESFLCLELKGKGETFTARVGVDDETSPRGSVVFKVLGDGQVLWESGTMTSGLKAKECSVKLTGITDLVLKVEDAEDGIDYDHADWADAKLVMTEGKPRVLAAPSAPVEPPVILTPAASETPRINGAKVFGVRPGAPFLFTIPATGVRPITFSADNLPAGLTLNAENGHITGVIKEKGEYKVTVHAKNSLGSASRPFKIVCGDLIALTPPMGWNSWNCFAGAVSAEKVKAAADAMVAKGLINHGWTYINIDDCWEAKDRDAQGKVGSNEKFPDMKALTDYIHGLGLKAGIYSSPGPLTCAGFTASYQHEELDALRYAEWGFDYLKYDWCSYGEIAPKNCTLDDYKKPYIVMRAALNKANRDIVFSLCQYGMGDVWNWGGEVGGNCWRTTGDITDTWRSLSGIGFAQNGHEKLIGPGHWNDPDMLIVGYVGWSDKVRPTRLTPNEQYTHITLWCLLNSPLLIGCDMTKLDDFTLSLLTNDEVLDVNQDPLGRQASRVAKVGNLEVWAKDMEDGSKAVGLFNRSDREEPITVNWTDLGITGKHVVRDLWRQKDEGSFEGKFTAPVPRHGAVLVKIQK